MILTDEGHILRIYISEERRYQHLPLYEWISRQALDDGLAGVTVMHGILGFGGHSRANHSGLPRLSVDKPIVIEVVDSRDKLEAFLRSIEGAISEGLATLEKLEVCFYRSGEGVAPRV